MKPPALILMAKAPAAGRVKTRLSPPLSAEDAAALAAAFIVDMGARVATVCAETGAAPIALHESEDDGAAIAALLPAGIRLTAQERGDLGRRLGAGIGAAFAAGHAGVVLVGADAPDLPGAFLREALAIVAGGNAATLTPVADGGYILIGLSRPAPRLFADIAWSTSSVAATTRLRAQEAGLALRETPPWFDVDTPEDLDALRDRIAAGAGDPAPATQAALARIAPRLDGAARSMSASVPTRPPAA